MVKGSFTLEAAVIIPIMMAIYILVINMGIGMYQEICQQQEQEAQKDMWVVDQFYKYQIVGEIVK